MTGDGSNSKEEPWSWPTSGSATSRYLKSLEPSQEQLTAFRSALGKVVHVCHRGVQDVDFEIVRTCGSVAKDTASAKSAPDLDVVVIVKELQPENLEEQVPRILDSIQEAMDKQYPGTRDVNWYRKFGLRYEIVGMEIDILVGAPNVLPKDFLYVEDEEQKRFMSASVSHLNKRFIKKQNRLFKIFVRVAKDWRDSFKWAKNCKPKSYLLEILMLHVFCEYKLCNPSSGRTYFMESPPYWWCKRILRDFFDLIANIKPYDPRNEYSQDKLPEVFVCFEPYYNRDDLPLVEDEPIFATTRVVGKGRNSRIKVRRATAIVMDPVNPTNNLWLTLADSGSQLIARAQETANDFDY